MFASLQARDVDDSFIDLFYSMQHHTLIGVASIPLNCIQTSQAVEFELPVISPSGLVCSVVYVLHQEFIYIMNSWLYVFLV